MKKTTQKKGARFRVIVGDDHFHPGEVISLKEDDGSSSPLFWKEDESGYYNIHFSDLGPYTKTIRDAQVGDLVVSRDGDEHLVLERGQNTVLISFGNEFKKSKDSYTFDELEEYYTLKDTPEVDGIMAEVMEILKSKGYKISRKYL